MQVAIQLLFCGVLLPGSVQDSTPAFLCSFHQAFPLCISLVFMWCIYTVLWTQLQLGRNFILLNRLDFHMIDSQSIAFHTLTKHRLDVAAEICELVNKF